MMVNLGGIVPLSTIDWIGRAAIVIFLRGCPLRCPHCHNKELQEGNSPVDISLLQKEMEKSLAMECSSDQITLDEAIRRATVKPFVSALVLSGGEPLMQPQQSAALLKLAKKYHLKTGLETSGYYPERLRDLLDAKLVDKIFLDLKDALLEQDYARATGRSGAAGQVLQSLRICMESGIPLDVRTTIFPEMPATSSVIDIAKMLSELGKEYPEHGLEFLILQQGRPCEGESDFEPVSLDELKGVAMMIEEMVAVKVRAAPRRELERAENCQSWPQEGRTSD
jgi:pyruvate formate lyase activating enzyme